MHALPYTSRHEISKLKKEEKKKEYMIKKGDDKIHLNN